jgi:hypothetical protein
MTQLIKTLCLIVFVSNVAFATHLRTADIIVRKKNCSGLTYIITVRAYLNTVSGTAFGGTTLEDGHISFGDGSVVIIPKSSPTPRPDLGPNFGIAEFTVEHTYSVNGIYKINYLERDRSQFVINMGDAANVPYSTYVMINAEGSSCNKFPELSVNPVDRACRGIAFFHAPGAVDPDGDSLSYELTIPSRSSTNFAESYIAPNDEQFYNDFQHGSELQTGPPSFTINSTTGLLTWDAPGMQGEYNIAFKIIEWKRDSNGDFVMVSTTVRDMQIIVEDCDNTRPSLTAPTDLCVEAGTKINQKIIGSDKENHHIKIELISDIFNLPEPASYTPHHTSFVPSRPPAEIQLTWNTNCSHVRDQSYQVVIKITDDPPSGQSLVTFKTINIKVTGPAPKWVAAEPDLVKRNALLQWENYSCGNIQVMQVWRKVGSYPFAKNNCVAGLSKNRGYKLIAELDPSTTTYLDDDNGRHLSVAAAYCYRLVAVFQTQGGKSYVSEEICVGPILADAPVITNVSIKKTDPIAGVVEVKWLKPFDISTVQYPEPYEYEVYRGTGFSSSGPYTNVSGRISDRSFEDVVNTRDSVYNYRIVLYSRTQNSTEISAIDTSAFASSVRLSAESGEKEIKLIWTAEVPWSNVLENRRHLIYRSIDTSSDEDLVLIDSVEVTEQGFEYTDTGSFNQQPLQEDKIYCYYVKTVGSYGNSAIPVLINKSQVICIYPKNNLPPCTPNLTVAQTDCNLFLQTTTCDGNEFANELTWSIPEAGCRKDIVSFKIYSSETVAGAYTLQQSDILEHHFKDPGLSDFAKCYRISSVDFQGIESSLSEPFCNENCPYFMLPNVFTPNGDGCNDLFSPYDVTEVNLECPPVSTTLCPRFVKSLTLKVLNRWGREIYEFHSVPGMSPIFHWDGKDKNGSLLDQGTYYYVAHVEFYSTNPAKSKVKVKGWVNLLY